MKALYKIGIAVGAVGLGYFIYKKIKGGVKVNIGGGAKKSADGDLQPGETPLTYQLTSQTAFASGDYITDSNGNTAAVDGDDGQGNMILSGINPPGATISGAITGSQSGATANVLTFNGQDVTGGQGQGQPSYSQPPADYGNPPSSSPGQSGGVNTTSGALDMTGQWSNVYGTRINVVGTSVPRDSNIQLSLQSDGTILYSGLRAGSIPQTGVVSPDGNTITWYSSADPQGYTKDSWIFMPPTGMGADGAASNIEQEYGATGSTEYSASASVSHPSLTGSWYDTTYTLHKISGNSIDGKTFSWKSAKTVKWNGLTGNISNNSDSIVWNNKTSWTTVSASPNPSPSNLALFHKNYNKKNPKQWSAQVKPKLIAAGMIHSDGSVRIHK